MAATARYHPYLLLLALSLGLGALSLVGLPAGIGSDAWAWLVWGRELTGLELDPTNGPSWKPLPPVFTTPLSLLGESAPILWTIVARAGAVLAVAFAYRLAARVAGPVAGAFATLGLLLTPLVDYAASADSEPLAAALVLWALERGLDGRRGQALGLLALAGLGRPEAWVLLVLYAAWVVWRRPRLLPVAAVSVLVPPGLWLGPPWLATGDPLSAGTRANRVTEASLATADVPVLAVAAAFAGLVALPVLAGALVATVASLSPALRHRAGVLGDRPAVRATLVLAAAAALWVALVGGLTQAGFTGNERYLFPAVAATCVLGGVGAGVIAAALGRGERRRTAVAVVVLLALAAPFGLARANDLASYRGEAAERARAIAGLSDAVRRAGGSERVRLPGCVAVTRPGTQGTLAWKLDLPLSAVERTWPPDPRLEIHPGSVVFSRAERRFDVRRAKGMLAPGLEAQPLTTRSRGWQVFLVAGFSAPPSPCNAPGAAIRRPLER